MVCVCVYLVGLTLQVLHPHLTQTPTPAAQGHQQGVGALQCLQSPLPRQPQPPRGGGGEQDGQLHCRAGQAVSALPGTLFFGGGGVGGEGNHLSGKFHGPLKNNQERWQHWSGFAKQQICRHTEASRPFHFSIA